MSKEKDFEKEEGFALPYLRAGYPCIWVETPEQSRAQDELADEANSSKKKNEKDTYEVYSWDIVGGLSQYAGGKKNGIEAGRGAQNDDPLWPLNFIKQAKNPCLMFLHNYHRFIKSIEILQTVLNIVDDLKSKRKHLIFLSPVIEIPKEIEKYVVVLNFDLPGESKLSDILDLQFKGLKSRYEEKKPEKLRQVADDLKKNRPLIIKAMLGLTAMEAENAIAHSLVRTGVFDPNCIAKMKSQLVKKSGTLSYSTFKEKFTDIGGLDILKEFSMKLVSDSTGSAKGCLLTGVPGCGKSMLVKALGNEVNLPVICLDFGSMFGSYVGESESRMRSALKIIDAVSPCIVIVDEIEKGLGGVRSSHLTDGGTGSRVFGTFLTWLEDKTSQSYMFATSNDIFKLPPEFLRAGRWDAIFFVDLPNSIEQETILRLYLDKYEVDRKGCPSLDGWSGAEIETLCRLAKILKTNCGGAAKYVKPLSESMSTEITKIRDWAKNRTIAASTPDANESDYGDSLRSIEMPDDDE